MGTRTTTIATAIVVFTDMLWGFYWMPVRALTEKGLPGAWGTAAITLGATLLLSPLSLRNWRRLADTDGLALIAIALGGAAFALYSIGFVYGRVAIIILLHFLTPVWSTLIGRYVMSWPTPHLRVLAIVVGLAGLFLMLGASGELPLPRGTGEWMALVAGVLWSLGTTGMRARSTLEPLPSAFVFASGAAVMSLVVAPFLEPFPSAPNGRALAEVAQIALATGGLWWGVSVASLMWATVRLEPTRVGILLMTEVVVGAVSAAVMASEHLLPLEIAAGVLVLCAGVLEVWPSKTRHVG